MKALWITLAATLSALPALAQEPDGLTLPPGFHASVVAEGLGPLRHLAFRSNGDLYASTGGENSKGDGLIAIRLGRSHTAEKVDHFSSVSGGTGIRFYHGRLYAAADNAIYRFSFSGNSLLPEEPESVVGGLPRAGNHPFAFDDSGNVFVGLGAQSNACTDPNAKPKGIKPCPDLVDGGGVWRFDASRMGQTFADGERIATGIRAMTALDWSRTAGLTGIMHGRDGAHRTWPDLISADDDDHIGDEMHHIVKGTDIGWPYTYYDGARSVRLVSPEYGGDGKITAQPGLYSQPVISFQPMRAVPVDIAFYDGSQFPAFWRGGAFVALHGSGGLALPTGRNGYTVAFVPYDRDGKAGPLQEFARGFAGPSPDDRNSGKAHYRPVGLAVAPDGALYVADSNKGRIWRISYGG
jgi:glucose/arabinose dehydrogenase